MNDKFELTRTIWGLAMLGIVFGSLFTVTHLGYAVLGLVFMIVVATIVVTGFLWQWGAPFASHGAGNSSHEEIEKQKRDRIEAVLRRLSDTQLQTLRERLSTGELTDEDLGDMLEDEARHKQKR